jgi:hypothetical protein
MKKVISEKWKKPIIITLNTKYDDFEYKLKQQGVNVDEIKVEFTNFERQYNNDKYMVPDLFAVVGFKHKSFVK